MLEQQRQNMEGLVLKLNPKAVLAQLTRTEICLEGAKPNLAGWDQ
jgi:hypothetical protein